MKTVCVAAGLGFAAFAVSPVFAGGPVVPAPEPVLMPAPTPAAPPATFAGAYVGADLGYAFGGDDRVGAIPLDRDLGTLELAGPIGNIHAGYRWQQPASRIVYGIEGMVSLGDVDADESRDGFDSSSEMKWTATIRGNLGYAVRPDTLVYGFAGYTVGKSEYWVVGAGDVLQEDRDMHGYVVGLGAEKMLSEKWSVRAEYQYSNFGREEGESRDGTFTTSDTPEYHTLRAGVNFRF